MEDKSKDKNLHSGHRIRIRERARKEGLQSFTEHQLLELLLSFVVARKDTNDLAHKLINEFGNLNNVLNAPYSALVNFNGLGDASASFLDLLPDIMEYCNKLRINDSQKITNAKEAIAVITPILEQVGNEYLVMLLMTQNDKLIHYETIAIGDSDRITVDIQELQLKVAKYHAKKVIFAHNHPDGHFGPSDNDNVFTKTAYLSLKIHGVELLDHYILTPDHSFYSYRQYGLLDKFQAELKSLLG